MCSSLFTGTLCVAFGGVVRGPCQHATFPWHCSLVPALCVLVPAGHQQRGFCLCSLFPRIVCFIQCLQIKSKVVPACAFLFPFLCPLVPRIVCCICHLQVISKGVPDDAMQGIPDRQVPLPDSLLNFQYMYNSTGSKVRGGCSSHMLCAFPCCCKLLPCNALYCLE